MGGKIRIFSLARKIIDMKWRNHVIINGSKSCKEVRYVIVLSIISRGEWSGNPANIKVENNGAVVTKW